VDASIPHDYRQDAPSAHRQQRPSRGVESPRFGLGQNRCDSIAARRLLAISDGSGRLRPDPRLGRSLRVSRFAGSTTRAVGTRVTQGFKPEPARGLLRPEHAIPGRRVLNQNPCCSCSSGRCAPSPCGGPLARDPPWSGQMPARPCASAAVRCGARLSPVVYGAVERQTARSHLLLRAVRRERR
jgi:hypothetical protein